MYADYTFYSENYGTAVSEADFPRFAARASAFIDKVTFGRAAQYSGDERLMHCCCEIIVAYAQTADSSGMVKQSETVGGWSYSLNSAAAEKTADDVAYSTCLTWLPAEWLYRGVGRE